jgi:hypothetical protein
MQIMKQLKFVNCYFQEEDTADIGPTLILFSNETCFISVGVLILRITSKRQRYPHTGLDMTLGLQEVEAPSISRQLAHEVGTVVSPMHWLPLSQGDIPGIHFC